MNKIAIIPAAGKSSRMFDLGRRYPKFLLPYEGHTVLYHNLKTLLAAGYRKTYIGVTSQVAMHELLDMTIRQVPEMQICVVRVDANGEFPEGPANTVYECMRAALNEDGPSFLVMLSDTVFRKIDLDEMPPDSMSVMRVSDNSRWCMVSNEARMLQFYDKPSPDEYVPTNLAASGIYAFEDGHFARFCFRCFLREADKTSETGLYPAIDIYQQTSQRKIELYEHSEESFVDYGTLEAFITNGNSCQPRAFNRVQMFRNEVLKSSVKFPSKINREREWLRLAPDFAKPFIPGLLSYAEGEYSMERIRGVNLRHLALYYDRSHSTWVDVFRQLRRFTCECHIRAERSTTDTLFWNQLLERVYERAGDNKAEARAYALKLADTLTETGFAKESSFMHGDLCFSNIIYRPGDKTVKLIDPRGDMSGHYLYDIAKLMHSVYGKYDYIDENLYVIGQDGTFFYDSEEDGMHLAFRDIIECHLSYGERKLAHVICAGLFLTMIPLHADNPEHQWLFLAEHKRLMAAL